MVLFHFTGADPSVWNGSYKRRSHPARHPRHLIMVQNYEVRRQKPSIGSNIIRGPSAVAKAWLRRVRVPLKKMLKSVDET
ncbi:hypothetical protein TNCV_2396511 [Trichonephila clavipes]|uniref:Uncharacterized protein n=1 Tax=Trichonephila clavipes TaxID=2585209 RepID=A0A8X6SR40_TRICX|nr:hypothetical protein TNCV_2396511 [Trichonephila clavipes]